MSFVKKAVKKVFNVVKKVVKKTVSFTKRVVKSKWFKIAVIVAASVFTAGLASGGFAAFSATGAFGAAGGGVGGFFAAVGSTMSTGWTAITSAVTGMFGVGGAATAAPAAASQPLMGWSATQGATGMLGTGIAGSTTGALAATAASGFVAPLASNVAGAVASKGILAKFGSLLMDPGVGGSLMRQGIMMGIQSKAQADYADKMEGYYRSKTVWGNSAFDDNATPMQWLQPMGAAPDEQEMDQMVMNNQMTPQEQVKIEMQQAQQAGQQQAPVGGGLLGIDPASPQNQMAMQQAPQQMQPPPANQPSGGGPGGLLNLETVGAYNA